MDITRKTEAVKEFTINKDLMSISLNKEGQINITLTKDYFVNELQRTITDFGSPMSCIENCGIRFCSKVGIEDILRGCFNQGILVNTDFSDAQQKIIKTIRG